MNDPDRDLLVDAADRLFADLASRERAAMTVPHDGEAWAAVEDSGFCDLLRSQAWGAGEGGVLAMADMATVAGRHGLRLPILSTMIARSLLDEAGIDVPRGALALGFAGGMGNCAERDAGIVQWVAAEGADHPVVAAAVGPRSAPDSADVQIVGSGSGLARTIAGDLVFRLDLRDHSRAGRQAVPAAVVRRHFMLAALGQSALISGALQRVLGMTVQYVSDRSIFGRKMKGFQAIQHQVAVAAEEVCAASAITQAAAAAFCEPMGEVLVAAARVRAADAIDVVNSTAHQLHGAMGFTLEFPLQRWTKLLWSSRDQYGSAVDWRRKVGRAFLGLPADELWPNLSGTTGQTN